MTPSLPRALAIAISTWATAAILVAPPVRAQGPALVSPFDPLHRDIERLRQEGLLEELPAGQRPATRRALLALVDQAERRLQRLAADHGSSSATADGRVMERRLTHARALIAALRARVGTSRAVVTDLAYLEGAHLDSPERAVPTNGLGRIDARTNPLANLRQGREYPEGAALAAGAGVTGTLGGHVAVSGQARSVLPAPGARSDGPRTTLERASLTLGGGNLLLTMGREELFLGQGRSSLAISGNAPALDGVILRTERPFHLPWLLRHFGGTTFTLLASDLGGDRSPAHDWLAGYKVSFQPIRQFEFGVTVLSQQGGSGSPPASPAERLIDLVPLLDAIFIADDDLQISNKFSGMDFRGRFPGARGLELYVEGLLDDFDARRLRSTFWDDVGWIVGATLPRMSRDGRWQGDVELRHTGIRYYEHGQFQSGFTRRRWLLGEPLGPNANGGYAWLRYVPSPATRVELALAQEWRNADTYSSSGGDAAETLRFHVVERRPREHRTRLVVTGEQRALRSSWGRLVTEAGYEHVRNFDFADGRSRGNLLGRIALEARY